jgi:hypothetical protein
MTLIYYSHQKIGHPHKNISQKTSQLSDKWILDQTDLKHITSVEYPTQSPRIHIRLSSTQNFKIDHIVGHKARLHK